MNRKEIYRAMKHRSEQIKSGRHRDRWGDFIDDTPPCTCCGPKDEQNIQRNRRDSKI